MASIRDYIRRVRGLRVAFRRTFNGPDGRPHADAQIVLAELRRFCYGDKPTIRTSKDGCVDPYASIVCAARQEVFMRIVKLINLNDRDLALMEKAAQQENADG